MYVFYAYLLIVKYVRIAQFSIWNIQQSCWKFPVESN